MLHNNPEKTDAQEAEVMVRFNVPKALHEEIMKYRGQMMTSQGRDIPLYEALVELLSKAVKMT